MTRTLYNLNVIAVALYKSSDDSLVSYILALRGLAIKPPWLNTRSIGALDAGTQSDLVAALYTCNACPDLS